MDIESVVLRGFRGFSAREVKLDFPAEGLVAVIGRNGSGKSTLVDNLHPYRIMPSRARSISTAAFSYYDHTYGKAVKELVWSHRGCRYRSLIEVDADKKKQSAYLFKIDSLGNAAPASCDGLESDGNTSTYDRLVESIVGDIEAYFMFAVVPQGTHGNILSSGKKLRSILCDLFGVTRIQALLEKCSTYFKGVSAEVDGLSRDLQLSVSSAVAAVDKARAKANEMRIECDNIISKLHVIGDSIKTPLSALKGEREVVAGRISELSDALSSLKLSLAKRSAELKASISANEGRIGELRAIMNKREQAVKALSSQLEEAKALAKKIESAERYLSDRSRQLDALIANSGFSGMSLESIYAMAKTACERAGSYTPPCAGTGMDLSCRLFKEHSAPRISAELASDIVSCVEAINSGMSELNKIRAEHSRLVSAVASASHAESDMANFRSELERLVTLNQSLQSQFNALSSSEESKRIASIAEELAALKKRLSDLDSQIANAEQAISRAGQLFSRLDAIEDVGISMIEQAVSGVDLGYILYRKSRLGYKMEEADIVKSLTIALSERGVQSMLLERAMDRVVEIANLLLASCANGRYSIGFSSVRDKKTGGLAVDFDIVVHDAEMGESRSAMSLSGGESVVVSEAISRAVMAAASEIFSRIETIVEDESDASLDNERRMEVLNMKKACISMGLFKKDIFVTHFPEIISACDYVISAPSFLYA